MGLDFIEFRSADPANEREEARETEAAGRLLQVAPVASHDKQPLAPEAQRNSTTAEAADIRQPYFVLGSQLESDAALGWLATGQVAAQVWPQQTCQLCQAEAEAEAEAGAGAGKSAPAPPTDCPTSNASGLAESSARWRANYGSAAEAPLGRLRPLVLAAQSVCLVITLCLICVILRIRKSRLIIVSGWLMLETMLVGALLLHASVS